MKPFHPFFILIVLFWMTAPLQAQDIHQPSQTGKDVRIDEKAVTKEMSINPETKPVRSPETKKSGNDEVEEIEDVEEVKEVKDIKEISPSGIPKSMSLGFVEILSRFHPAVVHIPIAWLFLLFLVDMATFMLRREELLRTGFYLAIGTWVSFIPAIVTGFLRASRLPSDADLNALMSSHRNLILVMATLCTIALGIRLGKKNRLEGVWKYLYLSLVTAAMAFILYAGHLGGKMVFGASYLPF